MLFLLEIIYMLFSSLKQNVFLTIFKFSNNTEIKFRFKNNQFVVNFDDKMLYIYIYRLIKLQHGTY